MKDFIKTILKHFTKFTLPYWCILLFDALIVFFSGLLVFWLFNGTGILVEHRFEVSRLLGLYTIAGFLGFRMFRTYSGIIRYSSFIDLLKVAYANFLTFCVVWAITVVTYLFDVRMPDGSEFFPSVSVTPPLLTFVLATCVMWGMRMLVKELYDVISSGADFRTRRVLIYGIQDGGVALGKMIRTQKPRQYTLCGFISHEKKLTNHRLMSKPVYNVDHRLENFIRNEKIEAILVSPLRNEEFRKDQPLQDLLINANVKIFMAQNVREWKSGNSLNEAQLQEVNIEDLIPRDEIQVDMKAIGELIHNKHVLITGSAGSIGSEIVRQVAACGPAGLMLIDQAETPQHDIRLLMQHDYPAVKAETIVTSICNAKRMEQLFKAFRPDYVFHAAAYKHVPMMEDNPSESVENNVQGTRVIADLSVKYGVKKFVMISTDKAVNPTNVMGCSKRLCEIYVQSLDKAIKEGRVKGCTQFVTTRFGNVLGSNGSVIPLFRKQIKEGGPVTVTHPDIIRFFMLIPEACKLVLEAGTMGRGGEIFVFDMGQPVRIADLAKRMIKLSGAKGVEITYTGLRDGEKLYEEVLNDEEVSRPAPTNNQKIKIAQVGQCDYEEACRQLDRLLEKARQFDDMETVRVMKEIVPEYKSKHSKYEVLDTPKS